MVSAVNTQTFANKKPKLLGSDTHAADLTGTVVADHETGVQGSLGTATINFSQNPRQSFLTINTKFCTLSSITVETGEKVLLTCFYASGYDNNSQTGASTVGLERDAAPIGTMFAVGNHSGNAIYTTSQFTDDPGAGSYVYRLNADTQLQDYQSVRLIANVIKSIDTHAADLTGSNTQSTKNSNIIGG